MRYLLTTSVHSLDGTVSDYDLLNIEKNGANELRNGLKNAVHKITSHMQEISLFTHEDVQKLTEKIKLLVNEQYAVGYIDQYSTSEVTRQRSKALEDLNMDWKLYDYQLALIGDVGAEFNISGVVSPALYRKLKSLKDSICQVTNLEYNSVCVQTKDNKLFYLTATETTEYTSTSDFFSLLGVKTIETVLNLNHLAHSPCVRSMFKIPEASYIGCKCDSHLYAKTFVYESAFNQRETFDMMGYKMTTMLEESTGNLYTIPDKDFNKLLKLI